jgi:formamidopyrimidine-DNA glycosylase
MPELPEVENTRRYLLQAGLPGCTFTDIQIGWAASVKRPSVEEFVLGVRGGQVQDVQRRGKYILVPLSKDGLSDDPTLILHLGMTGGLRIHPKSRPLPPMLRHSFTLDDGRELRFLDPRKFGHLWLVPGPQNVLSLLGPEPLDRDFTAEKLAKMLAGRNAPIKALLLEQTIMAGLGNLYADESLYLAGIHPMRSAADLSTEEISRLRDGVISALTTALAQYDQSRIEDWPDPPFALSPWTISRRSGELCPNCGTLVELIRVRGRSTYFCPQCQPGSVRLVP